MKPTITAKKIGFNGVEHGHVSLAGFCTDKNNYNCERQAGGDVIINPVRSARMNTKKSFSFKYGRVEVLAKTPTGNWLWPGKMNKKCYTVEFSKKKYSFTAF